MAQNHYQDARLSIHFETKHVVVNDQLINQLLDNGPVLLNENEKLLRLEEYINELYEEQLDPVVAPAVRRWRAELMLQVPLGESITLILADVETITVELQTGIPVDNIPNIPKVIQTQGVIPMLRIQVTGTKHIAHALPEAIIEWEEPDLGSNVTWEHFGASCNDRGEFHNLVEIPEPDE